MVYKFIVDQEKFKRKVINHYKKYINDGDYTLTRCYEMLACECEVIPRTIYNFTSNIYSIQLLMKIIDVLEVKDLEEILKQVY